MGADCKKVSQIHQDEVESNNDESHESSELIEQRRARARDDKFCFHCGIVLNEFNRCSGGVCYHCLKNNNHATEILAHAGQIFQALETSYRVQHFVSGIDQLRDIYFHTQIVQPHLDREKALNAIE